MVSTPRGAVRRFSSDEVTRWTKDQDQDIAFGDVVDETDASSLGVTFVRWGAGESGEFDYPLPYDEVLVVTKGSYTVRTPTAA